MPPSGRPHPCDEQRAQTCATSSPEIENSTILETEVLKMKRVRNSFRDRWEVCVTARPPDVQKHVSPVAVQLCASCRNGLQLLREDDIINADNHGNFLDRRTGRR